MDCGSLLPLSRQIACCLAKGRKGMWEIQREQPRQLDAVDSAMEAEGQEAPRSLNLAIPMKKKDIQLVFQCLA
jgi:hypothetical protein